MPVRGPLWGGPCEGAKGVREGLETYPKTKCGTHTTVSKKGCVNIVDFVQDHVVRFQDVVSLFCVDNVDATKKENGLQVWWFEKACTL